MISALVFLSSSLANEMKLERVVSLEGSSAHQGTPVDTIGYTAHIWPHEEVQGYTSSRRLGEESVDELYQRKTRGSRRIRQPHPTAIFKELTAGSPVTWLVDYPLISFLSILTSAALLLAAVELTSSTSRFSFKLRKLKAKIDGLETMTSCSVMPISIRYAAMTGDLNVLEKWVASGERNGDFYWRGVSTDLEVRDQSERTALHVAAKSGHADAVRLLCEAGADTCAQDKRRMTPLHLSAMHGDGQCIQILLQFRANSLAEDLNRMTPQQIAAISGHVKCAAILERAMTNGNGSEMFGAARADLREVI